MKTGIGSHQSGKMMNDEWLTPPEIVKELGPFLLDPCAPIKRPWDTAFHHYTKEDDGLRQPWAGRVWLNPPYGREASAWLDKLKKTRKRNRIDFRKNRNRNVLQTCLE